MQVPKLWNLLQNVSTIFMNSLSFNGNWKLIVMHIMGQVYFSKTTLANNFNQSKPAVDTLFGFSHICIIY